MQQDPNYGKHEEETSERYGAFAEDATRLNRVPVGGGLSGADERTWSMLSHLSGLLTLVSGIGGPVAALVIWLFYRERSGRVAFHALQSLIYQVAWVVILAVGWTITGILSLVLVGILLIPVMVIASVFPFVHQIYAAVKVNGGQDYRYPIIADMIDGSRRFSQR